MANYRLPTFNTSVNVWHNGTLVTDPPDVVFTGNFAWDRREHADGLDPAHPEQYTPFMTLLCPTGTDIRGYVDNAAAADTVEIPAASGRYYTVHYVDYIGLGFANEHLGAEVYMIPSPVPPPAGPSILEEDGTDVLLEDGSLMLLE